MKNSHKMSDLIGKKLKNNQASGPEASASPPVRILLIEHHTSDWVDIQGLIKNEHLSYELSSGNTLAEGLVRLQLKSADVLLIETPILDDSGAEWIRQACHLPCILIVPLDTLTSAVEIIQGGDADYLIRDRPWNQLTLLPALVDKVLNQKRFDEQNENQQHWMKQEM